MANNDKTKLKLLIIYDYFKYVFAQDEEYSTSIEKIQDRLYSLLNIDYERKSISNDIKTINEYMDMISKVDRKITMGDMKEEKHRDKDAEADNWIVQKQGKKEIRMHPSKDILTKDEIFRIYDASRATTLLDDSISKKIKTYWKRFFENYDDPFVCRKPPETSENYSRNLKLLRGAIANRTRRGKTLKITYGTKIEEKYKGERIYEKTHFISPIAFNYNNNRFYLYAIDNDIYNSRKAEVNAKKHSIRQYRVDRIYEVKELNSYERSLEKNEYISYDKQEIQKRIDSSVDGMFDGKSDNVQLVLTGEREMVAKVYGYIRDEVKTSMMYHSDDYSLIRIRVDVSVSGVFFSMLTNILSFNSSKDSEKHPLHIELIDTNGRYKAAYEEFLSKARDNLSFSEELH